MAGETKRSFFLSSGQFCSAIGCSNSRRKTKSLSFFRFTKDQERCRKWVINTRRQDLLGKPAGVLYKNNVLCAKHFETSQFMNATDRNKLIWCAVPTLFEIPNPPKIVTSTRPPPKQRKVSSHTSSTSTSLGTKSPCLNHDSPNSKRAKLPVSPRKKTLILSRKVKSLEQKLSRQKKKGQKPQKTTSSVEEISELLSEHLSGQTLDFVLSQIRVASKSKHAGRRTASEKSTALSFYHASPKSYRLLQSIFKLPSVSTLKRSISNLNLRPGFCQPILQALKIKLQSMLPHDRMCTVIFDEMSLKESVLYNAKSDTIQGFEDYGLCGRSRYVANHAFVFMVRGLFAKWKQLFAFFFTSGTVRDQMLKYLIIQAIDELQKVGALIKGVVCDQDSNNMSALKSMGVNSNNPFFVHNGSKRYVIYDPPHLLKNVRNNLKRNGLTCDSHQVSWKYVEAFYEQDCLLPVRMAPKLTKKHIMLPPFAALRVKLAAQVLSHSVAAGISTMTALGALPQDAKHTAMFLDTFDKLFNCLNSYTIKSNKPYQHALTETSNHHSFLQDILLWLNKIEGNSRVKVLPCIEGWKNFCESYA